MKAQIWIGAFTTAMIFSFPGCTKEDLASDPGAKMSRADVIKITEETARAAGYDIEEYDMTGCHFEFTCKDNTWSVFYELKPPTPPGAHFLVVVDDHTGKAHLAHGE